MGGGLGASRGARKNLDFLGPDFAQPAATLSSAPLAPNLTPQNPSSETADALNSATLETSGSALWAIAVGCLYARLYIAYNGG
eukprot:603896-Pyramimonas_sp.AAC.1